VAIDVTVASLAVLRDKLPSFDAARAFMLGCHDEKLLTTARNENPADEASVIYPESSALQPAASGG
jgi:hypothetical protein